jgi:phage shock protein A
MSTAIYQRGKSRRNDVIRIIRRAWRYFGAALEGKLEQIADPRIQVEQAIEEAKQQHALLTQQAAAVIGNERELDIRLNRAVDEIERLKTSTGQAIRMEDRARREDDAKTAAHFAAAAEALAGRLAAVEANAKELSELRTKAISASTAARRAVDQNALVLRQKLTERSRLLTELEAVRMQERLNAALGSVGELAPAGDLPTLDRIREKLDQRYARAIGRAEIASASVDARLLDVETSAIEQQGLRRLDEIRRTIDLGNG